MDCLDDSIIGMWNNRYAGREINADEPLNVKLMQLCCPFITTRPNASLKSYGSYKADLFGGDGFPEIS